jgi:hypothetical protein
MILVSQSYTTDSEERNEELRRARLLNEWCGLFDAVDYVDGSDHQWSFNELFAHCASKYRGQKCVVANADIAFHESAGLKEAISSGRLICLTRWEDSSGPNMLGHHFNAVSHVGALSVSGRVFSGTQDSWGFMAGELPDIPIEVPTGALGCDQLIAAWAATSGLFVSNPCLSVRTRHIHGSGVRGDRSFSVSGLYGYPEVTTLEATGWMAFHQWPGPLELTFAQCQP